MVAATFRPLHELPYSSPLDSPDNLDGWAGGIGSACFRFFKAPSAGPALDGARPCRTHWTFHSPQAHAPDRRRPTLFYATSSCWSSVQRAANVWRTAMQRHQRRSPATRTADALFGASIGHALMSDVSRNADLADAGSAASVPKRLWQAHRSDRAFRKLFCRRLYGRSSGARSEHATANAIDISGFVLSDGTHVSIVRDWHSVNDRGRFLHAARDGACRLFSTVLSPDYNGAHRDHLHIDLARRGELGWHACR
jgi:hypothetical protein